MYMCSTKGHRNANKENVGIRNIGNIGTKEHRNANKEVEAWLNIVFIPVFRVLSTPL